MINFISEKRDTLVESPVINPVIGAATVNRFSNFIDELMLKHLVTFNHCEYSSDLYFPWRHLESY